MIDPFRHNSWATIRLLRFCRDLQSSALDRSAPGTYGTIRQTLAHLVGSEERLALIVEGTPRREGPDVFTSLDDLIQRQAILAERWDRLLDPPPHPERPVEIPEGQRRRLVRLGTVLAQVVAHGNEHRTHVCTVLGTYGIDPPAIDGWAYGNWLRTHRQGSPAREAF